MSQAASGTGNLEAAELEERHRATDSATQAGTASHPVAVIKKLCASVPCVLCTVVRYLASTTSTQLFL